MHPPAHMLMGAALYGRRRTGLVWAGLLGGLLPDVPMYALFASARFNGEAGRQIFERDYFSERWQIANALAHSLLLWPALLALGLFMRRRSPAGAGALIGVAAAAGLTHAVVDFLCHREDAHMHFWPLSRWKFVSPVSYHDPAHYGRSFMIGEILLGLGLAAWLTVSLRHLPTRAACLLLALPYLAMGGFLLSR